MRRAPSPKGDNDVDRQCDQECQAGQDAEWQAFLNKHSTQPLPEDFSQQLALLAYAPDEQLLALPGEQRQQVFDTCALWVEQHHVAV